MTTDPRDRAAIEALQALFDALERSGPGRKLLSNIVLDYAEKRLAKKYVRHFLRELLKRWELRRRSAGTSVDLEPLVREVLETEAPKLRMRGKLIRLGKSERVSRVMAGRDFVVNYLKSYNHGWLPDRLSADDFVNLSKGLEGKIRAGTLPPYDPNRDSSGRVGWVTATDAIEQVRASHPEADFPNAVRDFLGLFHFAYGQLVEVRYPPNFTVRRGVRLANPTFLDGEPQLVYRSHHAQNRWGRTFNLRDPRDGLPEAVHPVVPIDHLFEVREIGEVSKTPPTVDVDRLDDECPRRWHPNDRDLLHELLSTAATRASKRQARAHHA